MATAIVSYVPAAALAGRAEKKPFVVLTYVFFTLFPLAVLASRSFRRARRRRSSIGGLREIGEPARKALIVDLADPAARGTDGRNSTTRSGDSRSRAPPPSAGRSGRSARPDLRGGRRPRRRRHALGDPLSAGRAAGLGGTGMKWVTRKRIHVNRTATGWLIRRFLDPAAEILFVEPDEVALVQEREGAVGFDAPGARYPHRDAQGRCSFEQLVDERLPDDPALARLARIVHGADFPEEIDDRRPSRRGSGRSARASRRSAATTRDILERAAFLYDSLYAHLRGGA